MCILSERHHVMSFVWDYPAPQYIALFSNIFPHVQSRNTVYIQTALRQEWKNIDNWLTYTGILASTEANNQIKSNPGLELVWFASQRIHTWSGGFVWC